MKYYFILLVTFFLFTVSSYSQEYSFAGAESLVNRVMGSKASQIKIEKISSENDKDVFELESIGKKICIRGNNGVAIASGLYYYLNNYCHAQITWNGVNMNLPEVLPSIPSKIHQSTLFDYRYYLNYCTFNYSMSWWDWNRWEKEIDWMALHGINMPLAITGEEYTWYLVYKDLGFTDEELKDFFCGPSYFSWFWMGNLDGWGGPLPLSWMKSHFELQQKILNRERALGMKPVLPAFTGHVPAAFKNKFPQAKLKSTNWNNGFQNTFILDANDSLFAIIGKKFLQKQTALLGTDHLYSADTFNENEPPSDEPQFLSALSAKVYEGMHNADTAAVWVMQGWLFYSDRKFWKEPQTKALLESVPNDKMIILDLATEIEPVWKRTEAFYGKPWIWNMLNNFGGNTNIFGRMDVVANEPVKAYNDEHKKNMKGIGLTMEAIEQNPVIYELMMSNVWAKDTINVNDWLKQYILNRYGKYNDELFSAWKILKNTAYTVKPEKYKRDGAESIIQARPTFDSSTHWANTKLNYENKDLLPAWDLLIKQSGVFKNSDGFQFDLVDVTRQVLANYASSIQQKFAVAYKENDWNSFNKYSQQFLQLISDMDHLLATRKEFLLGKWVSDARSWGVDEKEKALYEFNAKDLITLWGGKDCPLNEYACRQWSGLLNDFYKPRWELFFRSIADAKQRNQKFNESAFVASAKDWEWKWVNERKDYNTQTTGNAIDVAGVLYKKYRAIIE